MAKAKEYAVDVVAHLLALGLTKEEIYVQSKKEQRYYEFAFEISKKITENEFKAIYGHLNLGKVSANLLQYADILHLQLKEYMMENCCNSMRIIWHIHSMILKWVIVILGRDFFLTQGLRAYLGLLGG